MNNQRIIYGTPQGGVAIVIPAPETTLAELVESVPEGVPYEVVDAATVPADRTFRNAWEKSGGSIIHNLGKAKNIAHDKRRTARALEFAPLDLEATIPAKAQSAEIARQAIRDRYAVIQSDIDGATDIDQLKAIVVAENL